MMNKNNYKECGQLILSDEDLEKRDQGMSDEEILKEKLEQYDAIK